MPVGSCCAEIVANANETIGDSLDMEELAKKPNLTETVQARLSDDPCVEVRLALARNINLTSATITKLSNDDNLEVREAMKTRAT